MIDMHIHPDWMILADHLAEFVRDALRQEYRYAAAALLDSCRFATVVGKLQCNSSYSSLSLLNRIKTSFKTLDLAFRH